MATATLSRPKSAPPRKPKMVLGAPPPDDKSQRMGSAYRWVMVQVDGAIPKKADVLPKAYTAPTSDFDAKRKRVRGIWNDFEYAAHEALKINRRAIRRNLKRWAIIEHHAGQAGLEQRCRELSAVEGVSGRLSVHAFQSFNRDPQYPFTVRLMLTAGFDLQSPTVTVEQIIDALKGELDGVEASLGELDLEGGDA